MSGLFGKKGIVGVDISDHSIEVLQLNDKKEITAYSRLVLEGGIVRDGAIVDRARLSAKLKEALSVARPQSLFEDRKKNAFVFSLPESKTFIHIFTLPQTLSGNRLDVAVQEKVMKMVPLDQKNACWDYYVLGYNKEGQQLVLYAGVLYEVVHEFLRLFSELGIDEVIFDTEVASLGRSLLAEPSGEKAGVPTAIVDIGARSAVLGIFNGRNILALSAYIPVGGDYFTQKIAEDFHISLEEAEAVKRKEGFRSGEANNVRAILEGVMKDPLKEMQIAFHHYEERHRQEIGRVILAGGSALLPDIAEYFEQQLQKKVVIGDPLANINAAGVTVPQKNWAVFFSNVIGLALRDVKNTSSGINLLKRIGEVHTLDKENQVLQKITNMAQPSQELSQLLEKKRSQSRSKKIVVVLFALLALLFFGVVMYQYVFKKETPRAAAPSQQQVEVPAVPEEPQEVVTVDIPQEATPEVIATPEPPKVKYAVIQKTPIGWVNVRADAGTQFKILGKAIPGKSYEILEEKGSWYKIKLDEKIEGWVTSQYVAVQ